jgi:hypothetical protein
MICNNYVFCEITKGKNGSKIEQNSSSLMIILLFLLLVIQTKQI